MMILVLTLVNIMRKLIQMKNRITQEKTHYTNHYTRVLCNHILHKINILTFHLINITKEKCY